MPSANQVKPTEALYPYDLSIRFHTPLYTIAVRAGAATKNVSNHAAYIGHWLKVLQNDKRAIFQAVAHAKHAFDCLYEFQAAEAEPMAT